jgi:hypothetical protein
MEAKRRLMEQLLPEIYVDRYEIKGVSLKIPIGGDNDSYLPMIDRVTTSNPSYPSYRSQMIYIPFCDEPPLVKV